jgi:membrane fusion protein, multidrug efflux system
MRWYGQVAVAGVIAVSAYGINRHWASVQPYVPGAVLAVLKPLFPSLATPQQPAAGAPRPGGPGGGQPPVVEVLPVNTGVITEIAEAVGTTRAFESVVINAKVSGIIESIAFTEGATVRLGQELLKLDGAERRADWEAAKAAITQEEAKRQELRTKLERAQALRRTGSGTEALVDDLTAQVKTADSAIQNAIAKERAALARMNDMVVRAPFAGRVGIRQVSVGSFLQTSTNITTLDDISKVRLDFQIPENLLARVQQDAAVKATSLAFGDRRFDGKVAVIDTRVDTVTRSVKLTALVDNPDLALRPGMFLNIALEVAKRQNAVLIPEEAIVGEGPIQIAFAVVDNKVERRVLKVGQREDGKVEILDGLKAGEQIVVRGLQRVRAGVTVNARPFGSVPAQPGGQGVPGQGAPGQGTPGQPRPQPQAAAPAAPVPGQPATARP